ncbi:MAG: hypothetical protein AB7T31_09685 [Gemmatimonadales bacterium]
MTSGWLRSARRTSAVSIAVLLVGAGIPSAAAAQGGGLPTLSDAGLEYLSRTGFLQVTLSGQLDLEALHVGRGRWAGLVGGESADSVPADWMTACADCHRTEGVAPRGKGGTIVAPRLRTFADVFVGDHLYALVEGRLDRGHAPARGSFRARVEQAYVRLSTTGGSVALQVGRFASPFGSYASRHLTPADPFLRPPLAYDYRTVMNRSHAPPGAAGFLTWRNWPELFRLPGVPPVWDVPYQWGTMALAAFGPMELRAAAMSGAPSSAPDAWELSKDRLKHPSWVLGMRVRATPSLELGASYDRGPWLEEITAGTLPVPRSRWDFDQELMSGDLSFARGAWVLRGEVVLDRWEVPNLPDRPTEIAYGAEAQVDVAAGWSAAARVGYVDFRPLAGGPSGSTDWDRDVVRAEGSLGYRVVRNAGVLLSGYWQDAGSGGDTVLSGLRLWWAF